MISSVKKEIEYSVDAHETLKLGDSISSSNDWSRYHPNDGYDTIVSNHRSNSQRDTSSYYVPRGEVVHKYWDPSQDEMTVEEVDNHHPILIMTAGNRVLSREPIHSSNELSKIKKKLNFQSSCHQFKNTQSMNLFMIYYRVLSLLPKSEEDAKNADFRRVN